MRTYTYEIEADNQLHNCICGALSIKDCGVINILAKSLRRRMIELQLLHDFTLKCKSDLLKFSVGLFAQKTTLPIAIFEIQCLTDILLR